MSAAVLFRGHSYRPPGVTRPHGIDWRATVDTHRSMLLDPLRRRHGTVDTYLATYASEHLSAVVDDYRPVHTLVCSDSNTQSQTCVEGLRSLTTNYDVVVVVRFDLLLLRRPTEWGVQRPDCVNFMFKEWSENEWKSHRRVCDTIHVLPGDLVPAFAAGIERTTVDPQWLHGCYLPVEETTGGRVNVADERYLCSNTDARTNDLFRLWRVGPSRGRSHCPSVLASTLSRARSSRVRERIGEIIRRNR